MPETETQPDAAPESASVSEPAPAPESPPISAPAAAETEPQSTVTGAEPQSGASAQTPPVEVPSPAAVVTSPPAPTPEPQPNIPAPPPAVQESPRASPQSFLAKALEAIQFRKRAKLEKIMKLAAEKRSITNDHVQKLLRVSDATATR